VEPNREEDLKKKLDKILNVIQVFGKIQILILKQLLKKLLKHGMSKANISTMILVFQLKDMRRKHMNS